MTLKDRYFFPLIDNCIDSLGQAKIFSIMDAYSGYCEMYIRDEPRQKNAFVMHSVTFQYTGMPFGLRNDPEPFQWALYFILKNKLKASFVYLDDIITHSNSIEELIHHVKNILAGFWYADITLKIKKCKFYTIKVEYLGSIIKPKKF